MSSMLEVDLHEWCPEFDQDKEYYYGDCQIFIEMEPEIKTPQTDDIVLFTNANDPEQMPNEETETILGFCHTVRSSAVFHRTAHERPVAIVLECDSMGRYRKSCSPLKVSELYETLSTPRFKPKPRIQYANASSQDSECRLTIDERDLERVTSDTLTAGIPDAEKRLVLIVNLDEWVVWALAATVSQMQVVAVRSMISNHITCNAAVDVSIPTIGPRTFAMSFHLPFYVLRDTSRGTRIHDPRRLRNSQDVGFMRQTPQLGREPPPSCEFIYQVGVSCLVTGQNTRFWAAYMILDDYDEAEEGEILGEYKTGKEILDEHSLVLDPFIMVPISRPLMTPRAYFLKVLEMRSEQAGREWKHTVSNILTYLGSTGKRDHYIQSLYEHGDKGRSMRKSYLVWTNSVIKLIAKLKRGLGECTGAWASFTAPAGDLCYFHAPGKQWDTTKTNKLELVKIMKNFKRMSKMLRELETVDSELKTDMNELGHHLSYENNESAILQIATAKDVKVLTWVTFHSLPFTLVAGFMSTRAEILPLPETPATLVFCLIATEAIIWALLDRFSKGRYVARVKVALELTYSWVRDAVRLRIDPDTVVQA